MQVFPKEHIQFKTKPQLALDIIDSAFDLGLVLDWLGGDWLYGHNSELLNGLQSSLMQML